MFSELSEGLAGHSWAGLFTNGAAQASMRS